MYIQYHLHEVEKEIEEQRITRSKEEEKLHEVEKKKE